MNAKKKTNGLVVQIEEYDIRDGEKRTGMWNNEYQ